MARRMICHGAASRCITSDSANGNNCGVCSEGTLSAATTEAICGIAEAPARVREAGCPASPAPRAPAAPQPIDSRSSTTLGGPTRASARCLSSPGTGVAILTIASAAASWNLRTGGSDERPPRRRRAPWPVPPRIRAPARARRRAPAIARSAAARRGGSVLAGPENCPRRETARAGETTAAPDRRCARAPRPLPPPCARSCAIARARRLATASVFAPLDGALELPHQQRLRLRRKLREIIPQPLDRCLAHAPGVDACVLADGKTRPLAIIEARAR